MWPSTTSVDKKGRRPSSSSSSSSTNNSTTTSISSSPPPPPPPPPPKTMEEVWKDINLSSLHNDHQPSRATILQDFFSRDPFSKDHHLQSSSAAAAATNGSPHVPLLPTPVTILTLNSGPEFHLFGNSSGDPLRQNQHISNGSSISLNLPFLNCHNGKKRCPENLDQNSGDRRHKRMIKNRESAARSRARKQAYMQELEMEVKHLEEENLRLKEQQKQLCVAAAERPKKNSLQRTSTAPF